MSQSEAARKIGIHRTTLAKMVEKFGLIWPTLNNGMLPKAERKRKTSRRKGINKAKQKAEARAEAKKVRISASPEAIARSIKGR